MATESPAADDTIDIDLRNAPLAALLAWLWPGAGHLYQRRYGKGMLYMVCILSTWVFGLWLGNGQSVYASNRTIAQQLMYGCQLGVGAPALPALYKSMNPSEDHGPLLQRPFAERFMALPDDHDLHQFSLQMGLRYDMGILYTMIAGLLNVMAIFDAYGGPFVPAPEDPKKKKKGASPPDTPPTTAKKQP